LASQLSLIDNLCAAELDQIPLFKLFMDEKNTFLELIRFWCGGTACPVHPIHHPLFKTKTKTQNVVIRLVNSVNKESATIQVMISSYISTILELCRMFFFNAWWRLDKVAKKSKKTIIESIHVPLILFVILITQNQVDFCWFFLLLKFLMPYYFFKFHFIFIFDNPGCPD